MSFNIAKVGQASEIEHVIKAELYQGIYEASKETEWIRAVGLGVGIASAVLTVAKRIGRIIEEILKGVLNVVGSLCCVESCSFFGGVGMLLRAGYETTIRLPISLLAAVGGIFVKTIEILIEPTDYSHKLWMDHDAGERARHEAEKAQEKLQKAQAAFDQNPDDLENIKFIAHSHLHGIGTPVNQAKSLVYYNFAAMSLHDIESMKILAEISKNNDDYLAWWTFYNEAAKYGDANANYQVGLVWRALSSIRLSSDQNTALTFLREGKKQGSFHAQQILHLYYNEGTEPNLGISDKAKLLSEILSDEKKAREIAENLNV